MPRGGPLAWAGKPLSPSVALKDGAMMTGVLRSFQASAQRGRGQRLPAFPPPPQVHRCHPSTPRPQALLCSQGTYVLQDNSFPLLIRMAAGLQYLEEAPKVWRGLDWISPCVLSPRPELGG